MGTELSREDADWDRHGAFVEALCEAIGEIRASLGPNGRQISRFNLIISMR